MPCLQGGAFGLIHDILVTDQHYVVLENPIKMNFAKLLTKYAFAKACLAECLEYEGTKPTKIHVIPRPGKHSSFLGELGSLNSPHVAPEKTMLCREANQLCKEVWLTGGVR